MTARPKQRYRIAAIGAGRMGMGHVEAVVKCPRWELVYVCDLLDERLQLARHHAPHAHLTKKVEEILDDESVDAVTVNTLSDVRPSIVRKAIAAGKHVLCEKPLAPTPAEAKQLVEDIRGTDRLISVNLFNRNHAFLHRAKRFIQEGQIGELAIIRLNHCTSLYGPSAPSAHELVEGYVLHDCGMHYVDVARWFAESEYMEFDARVVRFWGLEYRLYFMVQGSFENGVLFDLNNSHCYGALAKQKRNNLSFEFIGSRGVITLAHTWDTVSIKMNGHTRTVEATMPYGGKNLDIYYRGFAEALDTGDLGHLPRIEDAVAASAYAQSMVDQALDREVANFQ